MIDLFSDQLLAAAKSIPCPYCRVDANEPCINLGTRKPLRFAPPHIKRLRNALALMELQ